jgi:hypothetical protein
MGNWVGQIPRVIILIMGLFGFGNSASRDLILSRGSHLRGNAGIMYHTTSYMSHSRNGSLFAHKSEMYILEIELLGPPRR